MLDQQSGSAGGGEWGEIPLRDGTRMAVRQRGEGPVLVLVHGWAAHGGFFDRVAEDLAGKFRVLCPDLRGHGATPAGRAPVSIPALADDLAQFLSDPSLDDAVLVGWSMGAMVIWSMIERHGPGRLAGLVIEDMSPRILNDDSWSLGMSSGLDGAASARAMQAMGEDWAGYAASFAPRMFSRQRARDERALVDHAVSQLAQRDPAAMTALWSSMAEQDLRGVLSTIELPVLVIYGEQSQAYAAATSHYLVDALPQAVAKGFARSGHAPHLEEPEEFCRAVSHFAHRVQAVAKPHHIIEGSIS